jgi:hypothetical protein
MHALRSIPRGCASHGGALLPSVPLSACWSLPAFPHSGAASRSLAPHTFRTTTRCLGSEDIPDADDKESKAYMMDPNLNNDIATDPALLAKLVQLLTDDASLEQPGAFCTNCCTPLVISTCEVCGHDTAKDEQLFNTQQQDAQPSSSSTDGSSSESRRAAAGRVVLGYDERMLQHRALVQPNPERADRLRAIMAQLQRSGVAE